MQINNGSSTEDSLYHYTKNLVGLSETDTASLTVAQFIRSANNWLHRAGYIAWKNDGNWKFDDSNNTDLPIALATLVDGQQTYTLPTTLFDVERVEVKDSAGNFVKLTQISKERISEAMSEYQEDAGMPNQYYLLNGTIFLYPKPSAGDVTLASGLRLYLSRHITEFTTASTTTEPGINTMCHPYIAYGAAMDYAIAKNMGAQRIQMLQVGLNRYEEMLKEIHAGRNKELKPNIKPKTRTSL